MDGNGSGTRSTFCGAAGPCAECLFYPGGRTKETERNGEIITPVEDPDLPGTPSRRSAAVVAEGIRRP